MILCPLMFYGSATEDDMNWHQFVIMFKSIFMEGLCRPEGGVRRLLEILRREYLARGGEMRLKTGVRRLTPQARGGVGIDLENGEHWMAGKIFSSAGKLETARLLELPEADCGEPGPMTFVETIFCLDQPASALGWSKSILFFSHKDEFHYGRPTSIVDTSSGVVCCPENFEGQQAFPEGVIRVTSIARYDGWKKLHAEGAAAYEHAKDGFVKAQLDSLASLGPSFQAHVTYRDAFTPLTIEKFTSHAAGAVYGAATKCLLGESGGNDVHLCGTDQGYLGIVGALLSGVIIANRHGLAT
jgi:phytoene dehydrogenase-like protein